MAEVNPYADLDQMPTAPPPALPGVHAADTGPNPYAGLDDPPMHASADATAESGSSSTPITTEGLLHAAKLVIPRMAVGVANQVEKAFNPGAILQDAVREKLGVEPSPTLTSTVTNALPDTYNPTSPENSPKNWAEKAIDWGGQGALTMVAPELLVGKLGTISKALSGAAQGIGGGVAHEVAPESLKPVAGLVGGLAGGLAAEGIGAGLRGAGTAIERVPVTKGQIERTAGQKILDAAEDPAALRAAAANPDRALVPGSEPTLGQLSGDKGVLGLEGAVARGSTDNAALFAARREEQNAARTDVLDKIQPAGDPASTAGFFRSQLADIDKRTQTLLDDATAAASKKTAGIGGLGATDDIGAALRKPLEDVNTAEKARMKTLFSAVDPDGTAHVFSNPLKAGAKSVYGNLTEAAKIGVTPAETAITDVIAKYGNRMPFRELGDIRSEISTAMRDAGVGTPAYGRLSQLRGDVEKTIDHTLGNLVSEEQKAVATGALAPEDTIESRMEAAFGGQRARWYAQRQAAAGSDAQAVGANGAVRSTPVSGLSGTNKQGRGQLPDAPGGPPVEAPSGASVAGEAPLLTQEQADAARTATSEYRTFKESQKPVEDLLKRQGYETSPHVVDTVKVPGKVWSAGPAGAQSVSRYLAFTKNSPESVAALGEAASASLQKMTKDGVLTDTAFQAWRKQHAEPLKVLEKAQPGTLAKYQDAATAGRTMEAAAATRATEMEAFQKSALAKVAGVEDAADVTRKIASALEGDGAVAKMRELAAAARKDPAAFQGLRKAVADHITEKLTGNAEAGTSGKSALKSDQFQTYVRKHDAALRQVMTPEEMSTLHAIAADLQRSNRSLTAIKVPGGSDSAQNIAAAAQHGQAPSAFGTIVHSLGSHTLGAVGATGAGWWAGGPLGALAGFSAVGLGHVVTALRARGITQANILVRDALLNPDLAHALLSKVPTSEGAAISFKNRMLRAMIVGEVGTETREREKRQ